MLTAYLWGGYLEWYARDLKTFVDSRVDIFEYAGVLRDYLDAIGLKQPWKFSKNTRFATVLLPPDEALVYVSGARSCMEGNL